ncbi:MAG TPA: LacI family DNA-binding transcriptional regulator, partial [Anaerolineaceae bacterium]|nr:LacI family DNA-binding transcriptional regulator [Anaerolineaceae bacterium]
MAKVTIRDVAKKAGVSTTTVSHVINETRFVEEKTRAKVNEAIAALGYRVNIAARSLRAGRSQTIGLIIPDAANLFFAEYSRKIEDFGFKAGYNVIVCNTDNETDKEAAYINALVSKQVDGVILISSTSDPETLNPLISHEVPFVIADREFSADVADVVSLNNEQAGFDIGNYLLNLGHREIGCITGPNNFSPSIQRLNGFIRAHKEWGVPYYPELTTSGKFTLS